MKRFIEHNMKRFIKHTFQPATKRNIALSAIELGVIVQGGFPLILTGLIAAITGFSVIFATGVLVAFGLFPLSIFIAPIAIGLFVAAVGAGVAAYGIRLGTKVAIARKEEIAQLADKWVPLQDKKNSSDNTNNYESKKEENDDGLEKTQHERDAFDLKEKKEPLEQNGVATEDDEDTKLEAEIREAGAKFEAEVREAVAEANPHLSPDEINSVIDSLKQLGEQLNKEKAEEERVSVFKRMPEIAEKVDTHSNTEDELESLGIPSHRPPFNPSESNTTKEECDKESDDLKGDQSTVTMKKD